MAELQPIRSWWERTRAQLRSSWSSIRRRVKSAAEGRRAGRANRPPSPTRAPLAALRWGGSIFAGLIIAIVLVLIFMDWNWLRGPISRYASHRLHRQIEIEGNLRVHLFSWTPRADVGGLRIANTQWAGGGDMADVGHLGMTVKLLPLLRGHVILPLVAVSNANVLLVRDADGRSNWHFEGEPNETRPLKLPAIQRFLIDGHVQIIDARRRLRFTGTVSSSESTMGRASGFWLTGTGSLNRSPFAADVHGAPLLNVDVTKPYPFTMDVRAGATRVTAQGQIDKPFDLGGIVADATFSGPDAADLYYLTGLVLPDTPPYRASMHIVRDEEVYRVIGLYGRMGQSDLAGALTVDASGDRPFVKGSLASRRVYIDDLGFLFGGGLGRKTAAPAPAVTRRAAATSPGITFAGARSVAQSTLLLPNAPLDVWRVRQMDADIDYSAKSIVSRDLPLRSIALHVGLEDGLLRFNPMKATLAQGTVSGSVRLDARRAVPVTSIDLRARDLKLEQLVPAVNGQPPLEGPVEARAILTGAGDTVHKAASNASGSVTFVVPHGLMRKAFAELLGINLLNGGIALLTGDQSQTTMRCMVAHFEAKNGVFAARNVILDTDVERGTGSGTIDMNTETVDLHFTGEAKQLRLLRMNAPIAITGSLSHPKIGVEAGKALGQGGLVVALAALVSPLAAILPTIDLGLAKDANCVALMAEAKTRGAPISRRTMLQTTPTAEHRH